MSCIPGPTAWLGYLLPGKLGLINISVACSLNLCSVARQLIELMLVILLILLSIVCFHFKQVFDKAPQYSGNLNRLSINKLKSVFCLILV